MEKGENENYGSYLYEWLHGKQDKTFKASHRSGFLYQLHPYDLSLILRLN